VTRHLVGGESDETAVADKSTCLDHIIEVSANGFSSRWPKKWAKILVDPMVFDSYDEDVTRLTTADVLTCTNLKAASQAT